MEIIIGNYEPSKDDVVINRFIPDVVLKKNIEGEHFKVIYVEYLGISTEDINFIIKNADEKTKLIFETKPSKSIKIPRSSKNCKVTRTEEVTFNPFDFIKSILSLQDRKYLFEFMLANKPALFLLIKILVSYAPQCSTNNKKVIEILDFYLYKVNPEILYAYMAFFIKPETQQYFKWRYAKK